MVSWARARKRTSGHQPSSGETSGDRKIFDSILFVARSKQLEGREVLSSSSGGQHTVILARDKK